MEIKETPDLWVLREKKRLRIPDVKQYAAVCAVKIDAEIMEAGLEIDGPWLFISRNLPKDSKTFFDWEICRPVKKTDRYEGKLELVHLEPIMVATKVHQGSLRTLFTKGMRRLPPKWICPAISTQAKAGRSIMAGTAPGLRITTSKSSLAWRVERFAKIPTF